MNVVKCEVNLSSSTKIGPIGNDNGGFIPHNCVNNQNNFYDHYSMSILVFLDSLAESLWAIYEPALQIYAALWIAWIFTRYSLVRLPFLKGLLECCILNWTVTMGLPLLGPPGFLAFYLFRHCLNQFLKWISSGRKFLMCGSDAVWGTESYANACNFTSLYILQGTCDINKIRSKILNGVVEVEVGGEKIYNKLKWRASSWYTFPIWEKMDKSFNINQHVKILNEELNGNCILVVPNGIKKSTPIRSRSYTEDDVFDEISKFFDHPLKNDKPQWEILVAPKYVYKDPGKKGNYYALIFRIHHSIMDGVSAGFALQNAIADSPPKLTVNPLAPLKISRLQKIMGYLAIWMFGLHDALKSSMLKESNCFHGPELTGPKKLGWSQPVDLQALKCMKNATKTSTTAVLMSAVGTSLRNLAIKKNLKVPKVIHSSLTVAILPYPNMKPQNRFTVAHLPMKLNLNSTLERIKSTYKNAQKLAWSSEPLVNFYLMRLLGESTTWLCKLFSHVLHATLLLSNVPGPAEKVTLFNGDQLEDVIFWTPLRNSVGISMSIFSYDGKVRVGMVADSVVFPDPTDVSILIQEFEKEIIYTGIIAGISKENCFVK